VGVKFLDKVLETVSPMLEHISYSTIVLYSRDHQGLGMAHKNITQKLASLLSQMMWQHWLGKTKPKKSLQIDPKRFQQVATEF